jgi:tetratricopeptide (TPR) repeat protein
LFAWHPLRVESVAWVAERKDVLSGFFGFIVLWSYAAYARRRTSGLAGARRFYALALVAFALGLMAKPMLVTMPCVLLLLDYWPLRRLQADVKVATNEKTSRHAPHADSAALFASLPRLLGEKLPFFALAVASSYVTYAVQKSGGSVSAVLGLDARLANAAISVVRYLGKFVWPFDLAVLYPHPGDWPTRKVVAATVVLGALTAAAWFQRRRRPWILVGWLWFIGTLVPVIGIVQVGLQAMADRYTYLPMLGIQLGLLWTVAEWLPEKEARRGWALAAVAVLVAFSVRTWNQLGHWKNSGTLFDHAIAVTTNNYLAYNNRGIYLCEIGRTDEGIADYRRSIALKPDYPEANNNLARLLVHQGRAAEAVPMLRLAVKGKPDSLEARNNLANALSDIGALPEAMENYEYILARQPRHVDALTNSGVAFAMQGNLPAARDRIESALQVDPDNLSAHSNLGNVYAMLGQRDAALRHYRRAIELSPTDARAHHNLGNLLSEAGDLVGAAKSYEQAVAAAPTNAESRAHLGFTYARLGRREDALRELRVALAQRPDYPQAKAWLQMVLEAK